MSSTQEVGDIFGEGKGPAQAMLRSPTVLIVAIGLWGMNVFFFRLFRINYRYVLEYDLLQEEKQRKSQQTPENDKVALIGVGGNDNNEEKEKAQATSTSSSISSTHDEEEDPFFRNYSPTAAMATESSVKEGEAITWYKLVLYSFVLLLVLHYTTHLWMGQEHFDMGVIGAVALFYTLLLVSVLVPLASNRWLRRAFRIVIGRTCELLHPRFLYNKRLRPIPFIDVFYADAMCSLSKVFFDWGMLVHMALHYPDPVPPNLHNILIPSFCAAIPYLIRARQCLVMFFIGKQKADPKRVQHTANAIKYSTSIWPLCLSAYQRTVDPKQAEGLEGYLILLLTINASYSLYWDIVMDWGMMQSPSTVITQAVGCAPTYPIAPSLSSASLTPLEISSPTKASSSTTCQMGCLRPRLRFGWTISTLILVADSILRFSWMLRFVPQIFPNEDSYVLCTQFLEVFRRAIWNLLRVEWENIKQKQNIIKEKRRDSYREHHENDEEDVGALITNVS